MKLRIKYNSNRSTIDIETTATLKDLHDRCKEIYGESDFFLSLNGEDEIAYPDEQHLSSIGLVPNDLIHIIKRENNHLYLQLLGMGFEQKDISEVLNLSGVTNLNDAIELLVVSSSTSTQTASKTSSAATKTLDQTKESAECEKVTIEKQVEPIAIEKTDNLKSKTKSTPLFLQDGITNSFKRLFENIKCDKDSDYLFLLIHGLVLETGFEIQENSATTDSENEAKESYPNLATLPGQWKNSDMGFYRLCYTYTFATNFKCCLTGTVTGKSMVISGTLDADDSEAYQMKLKISDYICAEGISTGIAGNIYMNIGKLSHKVKDGITTKVINEIRSKLGLQEEMIGLSTLPSEIQLSIISLLDVFSICCLSQVNHNMQMVCNNESVWKIVLHRDFRASNPVGTTYKQAVVHMHKVRQEEKRRDKEYQESLRQPRTLLRPDFEIEPDILYPHAARAGVSGIIGGYNDLYPSAGFQPGGFPANPLHIPQTTRPDLFHNPGRLPGWLDLHPPRARFDPYGPIPDESYLSGRQSHPDMLHRPQFGRGNGFGAGFGFT